MATDGSPVIQSQVDHHTLAHGPMAVLPLSLVPPRLLSRLLVIPCCFHPWKCPLPMGHPWNLSLPLEHCLVLHPCSCCPPVPVTHLAIAALWSGVRVLLDPERLCVYRWMWVGDWPASVMVRRWWTGGLSGWSLPAWLGGGKVYVRINPAPAPAR